MSLINCRNCGHEISDKCKICPHCKNPVVKETDLESENTLNGTIVICDECGRECNCEDEVCNYCGYPLKGVRGTECLSGNEFCGNCGYPSNNNKLKQSFLVFISNATNNGKFDINTMKQSFKNNQKSIVIVVFLLIVVGIISIIGVQFSIHRKYERIISDVYVLIDDKSYEDAYNLLRENPKMPDYERIERKVRNSLLAYIDECMVSGNYIEAYRVYQDNINLANDAKILETIKYESLALTCLMNLKPHMKNPSSLQAKFISFHPSNDSCDYPAIIINESGQNGFGGYSTAYCYFSASDLSFVGSCPTSLDYSDCDDAAEKLVCAMVTVKLEGKTYDTPIDINRINSILINNVTPNIDVTVFADKGAYTDE